MMGTCASCLKRKKVQALGIYLPRHEGESIIYPLCDSCLKEGMLHPEHTEAIVASIERNINSLPTQTRCRYLWDSVSAQHFIHRSIKLKVELSRRQRGDGSERTAETT